MKFSAKLNKEEERNKPSLRGPVQDCTDILGHPISDSGSDSVSDVREGGTVVQVPLSDV